MDRAADSGSRRTHCAGVDTRGRNQGHDVFVSQALIYPGKRKAGMRSKSHTPAVGRLRNASTLAIGGSCDQYRANGERSGL